ncbi:replicative DNA helicase [Nocardiopsis sp. NRRL B-16309]|uniref:replicative DNA helicase n=1 Tax=Nocardiopsis sp. NRRL B-16309 TaxID=1519494 RepID=UPI0006B05091|nr:replicative DNA helicase [Nocardiopsis sp. NRRL B-16309]KOX10165.1 hypothetical protein ADL05_26185 [Nocardiopsis sp. NRRL B-16309]
MTEFDDIVGDRMPPNDIEAEQAVLGGMLLSTDAISRAMEIVAAGDFFRPAHQMIFDAITDLHTRGEKVDVLVVNTELSKRGEALRCGGPAHLFGLTEKIPVAANTGYYAKRVKDVAILRRLTEIGTSISELGYAGAGEIGEIVEDAREFMASVDATPVDADALVDTGQVFQELVEDLDAPADVSGLVPMPWSDLAHVLPGLKPGQMMLIGARPGAGKSIAAADIARHASMKHQIGTVMFSLEMTRREMGMRIAAAEGSIDVGRMSKKKMTSDDWDRLARVKERFDSAPFWMADDFSIGLSHIRAHLSRLTRRHKVGLVLIDYLQLMSPGGKAENRQIEVSAMSRGLKKLAGEFGVAMVVLSQLNRESTKRADKRPQLSDLRESGSLEQDADVVLMLHREDLQEEDSPRSGEVDLLLEKNRGGKPKVTVTCAFQGHYSRIVDMAGTGWGQ